MFKVFKLKFCFNCQCAVEKESFIKNVAWWLCLNFISECKSLLDVVLMVDTSGSIVDSDPNNWNVIKTFLSQLLGPLNIAPDGIRVGIITFSNRVKILSHMDAMAKENLLMLVSRLPLPYGRTSTATALNVLDEMMFNVDYGDRPGNCNPV